MPTAVQTIQIRNPRIIEQVLGEMAHGAGRNPTEAAENLISQGSEQRRIERAREGDGQSAPRTRDRRAS